MTTTTKTTTLKGIVRNFLKERKEAIETEDPSIITRDRLTLSTIWYRLRKEIRAWYGVDSDENLKKGTRRMVQNDYVNDIFKNELKIKRSELGIHAAVKAQLYYRGKTYDITPDNLETLASMGVGMVAIEKEGVADTLAPFTVNTAISIMNSRGFFTENADDLCEVVKDKLGGRNMGVIHDFDASGVVIGKKSGFFNLGIDPPLLEELGINIEDVEEEYNGLEGGHWKWLNENLADDDPDRKHLEYLKTKRVEIDSVIAAVGAEKLWEAICARFEKAFPTRDYTRVIDMDALLTPPAPSTIEFEYDSVVVDKLNGHISNITEQIAENKKDEIRKELKDYPGIPVVEDLEEQKREEYDEACREEDPESADILSVCEPIVKQLEEVIDEKTRPQQEEIDELRAQISELEYEIEAKEDEINEIASSEVEQAERDQIIPAIKKLDEEEGYNIVKEAGLEEEEEEDDDAPQ
jgi:hypothetical protein